MLVVRKNDGGIFLFVAGGSITARVPNGICRNSIAVFITVYGNVCQDQRWQLYEDRRTSSKSENVTFQRILMGNHRAKRPLYRSRKGQEAKWDSILPPTVYRAKLLNVFHINASTQCISNNTILLMNIH